MTNYWNKGPFKPIFERYGYSTVREVAEELEKIGYPAKKITVQSQLSRLFEGKTKKSGIEEYLLKLCNNDPALTEELAIVKKRKIEPHSPRDTLTEVLDSFYQHIKTSYNKLPITTKYEVLKEFQTFSENLDNRLKEYLQR